MATTEVMGEPKTNISSISFNLPKKETTQSNYLLFKCEKIHFETSTDLFSMYFVVLIMAFVVST